MEMLDRPLAITDVETTGLDVGMHEIIEIGLIVVDQADLQPLYEFETKVLPTHIQTASKRALEINGYTPETWVGAPDMLRAIKAYNDLTKNAIFTAHNMAFDWQFIQAAFKSFGLEPQMDYHRLDLFSLVWGQRHKLPGLTKFNLNELCKYFGLEPEPEPHRAINGVRSELEVLRCLNRL